MTSPDVLVDVILRPQGQQSTMMRRSGAAPLRRGIEPARADPILA